MTVIILSECHAGNSAMTGEDCYDLQCIYLGGCTEGQWMFALQVDYQTPRHHGYREHEDVA